MRSMIAHYDTNLDQQTCKCGESVLISKLLQNKIPCSHLIFLGMEFPKINPPDLDTTINLTGEIFFEYEIDSNSNEVELDLNYYSYIRNYAVKIIKKYSHNKDKKNEISSYAQEELNFIEPPQEFALGYPVEVFKVIYEGIKKFYVPKKKNYK